uniref:Uncharacterized protein n=1 Tax=Anguilla anguilla TaxID=7936 RepID=A0A0E9UY27_ANGAN
MGNQTVSLENAPGQPCQLLLNGLSR